MNKQFKKILGSVLVIAISLMANVSFAAITVEKVISSFPATAGETLTTGDLVYISTSDGYVYLADSDGSSTYPAIGVIGDLTGAAGSVVQVVTEGIFAGLTSSTPNSLLFISATAGEIAIGASKATPAYAQVIGFVLPPVAGGTSSERFYFRPDSSPGAK